jgi:hypothetical protein
MEKPLLGLVRKNDKATKLHHDLQITILQEDCKSFDIFLICFCLGSLIYEIVWYSLEHNQLKITQNIPRNIKHIVLDVIAIAIWIFGLFVSIKSIHSYKLMKSKPIHDGAKMFFVYLVIQTLYFIVTTVLQVVLVISKNDSGLNFNEKILTLSLAMFLILSFIFLSLYFYLQKLGLVEEIEKFDVNSNKNNAVYRKASKFLDI